MMKRTKAILKAAAVCCVLWMLQTPMIVRADLIWEPIEEELIIYEETVQAAGSTSAQTAFKS
jgi:hypothetical protein